jgi:uncharacterized membrane protein YbhN (UPF0104 family)
VSTLAAAIETFASRLSHVSVTLLLVGVGLHVCSLLLRATAWRSVLAAAVPSRRAPWRGVTGAYLAGAAVNNVVPARGGDVARVMLASQAVPEACCATVASGLLVETVLDAVIGGALVAWAVWSGALPLNEIAIELPGGTPGVLVAAVAVPAAVVVAACCARGRAIALAGQIRRGFSILHSPRAYLLRVALPQTLGWAARVLAMYAFLQAFHIDGQLSDAALVLIAGSVTTLLPLTPSGVGTQQALLVVLLAPITSPAAAISFSLGTQLVLTVVNVGLGGTCMAMMLGTAPWRARAERPAPAEPASQPAPQLVPVTAPVSAD